MRVDSSILVDYAKFFGIAVVLLHWDLIWALGVEEYVEAGHIDVVVPGYIDSRQIWSEGLLVLFLLGSAGFFLLRTSLLVKLLLLSVLPIPEIIYLHWWEIDNGVDNWWWHLVTTAYVFIYAGMALSYCCNMVWSYYGIDITRPGLKNARATDISILIIICTGIVLSEYARTYLLHLHGSA